MGRTNTKGMEKVSIIIPAYNKDELTVRTVKSVLDQSYPNIEIIVVDDGSTDRTKELLSVFGNRIRYIYKQNGGACGARNLGIRESSGQYVGFLDCDDLYMEKKVEQGIGFLREHPQYGYVHTDAYFIDRQDNIVGQYRNNKAKRFQGWISQRLILGNFVCNSTVLVRRFCLEKAGFFDEEIFTPADWDMWMRLAEIQKAGYIDQPLTKYRVTDNYILNKLTLAKKEEEYVVEKFFRRNSRWRGPLQKKAESNLHLRFAQCYLLKDNSQALKKEFCECLKCSPFNLMALAMLLYYVINKSGLKSDLRERVLRYEEGPFKNN